jgi:hypothetical protein
MVIQGNRVLEARWDFRVIEVSLVIQVPRANKENKVSGEIEVILVLWD